MALLSILALPRGASSHEVCHLRATGTDHKAKTPRLGNRPLPVPLDPASRRTLQRCLEHWERQRTGDRHMMVTKGSKAGRVAASTAYLSCLSDACSVPPSALRSTRLATLVSSADAGLAAAALGMNPEGVMFYLADHVDDRRPPERLASGGLNER